MRTEKLTCQNCGANLDVDGKIAFCSYCGAKLIIDDENRTYTHNYNYSYSYTKKDEARFRESETKERIRLKELENEENEKKREHKETKWILLGLAAIGIICFCSLFLMAECEKPNDDEIKMPCSVSEYEGENYEIVVQELEDLGFDKIETAQKKDLVTGWLTKDGEVYKVSINGDSDFSEGDIFPEDSKVVVTYHTFRD